MTPSNDNQPDKTSDKKEEFARTIKLMRCQKHGVSFFVGDVCPECDKENKPSPQDTAS
ncbi:MAG TPA: hypothetical protein VEP71_01985 [Gallionella sp.]|nr:hypothetical protein [Gallionella sp.]